MCELSAAAEKLRMQGELATTRRKAAVRASMIEAACEKQVSRSQKKCRGRSRSEQKTKNKPNNKNSKRHQPKQPTANSKTAKHKHNQQQRNDICTNPGTSKVHTLHQATRKLDSHYSPALHSARMSRNVNAASFSDCFSVAIPSPTTIPQHCPPTNSPAPTWHNNVYTARTTLPRYNSQTLQPVPSAQQRARAWWCLLTELASSALSLPDTTKQRRQQQRRWRRRRHAFRPHHRSSKG